MQTFLKPKTGVRTDQLQTFREELRRSGFVEKIEPKREANQDVMLHVDAITNRQRFVKEVPDSQNTGVRWNSEVWVYERVDSLAIREVVTEVRIFAHSNVSEINQTLAVAFPNKCLGVIDPERIAWPTNLNQTREAKNYRDAPEFETVNLVTIEGVNRAIAEVQRAEIIAVQIGVATRKQLNEYFEADAKVLDIEKLRDMWAGGMAKDERTRDFAMDLLKKATFELQQVQEGVREKAKKLAENEDLLRIMNTYVANR